MKLIPICATLRSIGADLATDLKLFPVLAEIRSEHVKKVVAPAVLYRLAQQTSLLTIIRLLAPFALLFTSSLRHSSSLDDGEPSVI